MTNRYKVEMVVTGKTVNEVSSKMMVAAYAHDFDIEDLKVERLVERTEKWLEETNGVEDNPPGAEFHFPHVQELVKHLRAEHGN
jgi:hypothetical protein